MKRHLSPFKSFASDQSGATSIEYALIAAIVSIAIVAGLTTMKTSLQSTLSKVSTELAAAAAN